MAVDGETMGWKQPGIAFSPYTILQQHPMMKSFVNKFGGGEEAIPGWFELHFPPTPAICLKIQFLAIYPHLRLLMGDPLTPPPLLLTKMLLLDAIAIIYMGKKLIQAVSTPLSRHLLPFA